MDKQELQQKITEIGACEDDVTRRDLLTSLAEACESDYDTLAQLRTDNETLKNDNETLRSANMKLFLKVGESKSKNETLENETGIKEPEKNKKSLLEIFNS